MAMRGGKDPGDLERELASLREEVAELRARESTVGGEVRFRTLFHNISDAAFVHGLRHDGLPDRYLEVNPAACERLGYTRREMLELCPLDINRPEARVGVCPQMSRLLLEQGSALFETEHMAKDGRAIPVEVMVHVFNVNGRKLALSIARDITERRLAEETRRISEERLRQVVQNMPALMDAFDEHGVLQVWNRECERVTGFSAQEMVGNPDCLKMLYPDPEYRAWIQAELERREHTFRDLELTLACKDGSSRIISWSNLSRRFPVSGWHTWAVGVDVTRERALSRELTGAKEQAEAANQAKSSFLANMSHEIRTPLNGVLGMLQLLELTGLDESQRQFVGTALESSNVLLELISDILDLSRVEAGRLELSMGPLSPCQMVRGLCRHFERTARAKGLDLTVDGRDRLPAQVVGDAGRIRQVLFNLLGNAVKFTAKGRVDLSCDLIRSQHPERGQLLFIVEDTGIGIDPGAMSTIFEPFRQAEDSLNRRFQGTGLGLSIVRRLVQAMHGSLCIESEPGAGTCAHLALPVRLREKAEGAKAENSVLACALRVLVVEDNEINAAAMHLLLEGLGHRVLLAENGREALEILAREAVDCVLMDVQMPVMNGLEATRRIRDGQAGNPDVPIVALTAHALVGDRERFLEAGMDHYLAKPVNRNRLAQLLERVAISL